MMSHDKQHWQLQKLCSSDKEYMLLQSTIVQNWELITDIYRYLQAKSDRYPWVSYSCLRTKFFRQSVMK